MKYDQCSLAKMPCTPCQGGIPPMSPTQAEDYVAGVPGWALLENATKIKRTFHGADFKGALELANKIGALCEQEGHHADITIGWGYCRVVFQTHKINGLHENDFIMASKVTELVSGFPSSFT